MIVNRIGFPDNDPVLGAPLLDGFTGIQDAGVITLEAGEAGYGLGHRITYANGSNLAPVYVQAIREAGSDFIYLSFFVRYCESFSPVDVIVISIRQKFSNKQHDDTVRRIDIYPVIDGVGASDVRGGSGPGDPTNASLYSIRNNRLARNIDHWRGQGGGIPWSSYSGPPGFRENNVRVRSWQPPVPSGQPLEFAWSLEVKIPLSPVSGGPDWIDLTDASSFGLYYSVFRETPSSPAGIVQFCFPRDTENPTDNAIVGPVSEATQIDPLWYGEAVIGASLGQGVRLFQGMETSVGVRANTDPANSPLGHQIRGDRVNRLVARIQNTGPTDAAQVTAEFRFANWGLNNSVFPLWTKPDSLAGNPTPPINLAASADGEVVADWPGSAIPAAYQPPRDHQCMFVQLSSSQAVNFVQSGMRRNMDFVNLSSVERAAHVSGAGYPQPQDGRTHHDFVLAVHVRQVPVERPVINIVAAAPVLPASSVDKTAVDWIWIVNGYRRTGKTVTIQGKTLEILDDSPGAFGFVARHGDIRDRFTYRIKGAGLRRLSRNAFGLAVPHDGEVVIDTKLRATPPEPPFADDVPYIGSWLVLGPIFDPAHQPGSHFADATRPSAGDIVLAIDNHNTQVDPVALTANTAGSPGHGDIVRSYGGTLMTPRPYVWRKRSFIGLDWDARYDVADNIHTHLGGDYAVDPADPYQHLNFAGKHHALAFFLIYVVSPDRRATRLALRHDDALRMWLNGVEIEKEDELPFADDNDLTDALETIAPITLHAGTNILLAAVAETQIEWGFSARIEDHHGLRITADHPDRDAIRRCESQYRYLSIAGSGNGWDRGDLGRVLACVGGRVWKGRVRLDEEDFKFVGHRTGWLSDWLGWNNADWPFGNFHCATAGIYDVVFDEDQPHDPVLILVRPFA